MSIGEEVVGEHSKTSFRNSEIEFQLSVSPVCNKTFQILMHSLTFGWKQKWNDLEIIQITIIIKYY